MTDEIESIVDSVLIKDGCCYGCHVTSPEGKPGGGYMRVSGCNRYRWHCNACINERKGNMGFYRRGAYVGPVDLSKLLELYD